MTRTHRAASPVKNLSSIFDQPNVWSDWHASEYIGPLSWVRMAALLMRNVSPETVINALAPALRAMRDEMEAEIIRSSAHPPEDVRYTVDVDGYRSLFEDSVPKAFAAFITRLEGDADAMWLRERIEQDSVWEESFLWFFLNGIAYASANDQLDLDMVKDEARWLAELEFFENPYIPADQFLIRHFYGQLHARHDFVAPPSEEFRFQSRPIDPFHNWQDDWVTRRRNVEDRWERELNRAHAPLDGELDWPEDACLRSRHINPWERALDIARIPPFDWRRQVALMLRDVPLDALIPELDAALITMADKTARIVVERAQNRGQAIEAITFFDWFNWWRENFRHWNDPLRGALNEFCSTGDASFVGDWLNRFNSAVFADFLIQSAHGHIIDRELGFGSKDAPKLDTELFSIDKDEPINPICIVAMTWRVWGRFRGEHDVQYDPAQAWCDFDVDLNVPLERRQPNSL